MLEQLFRMIKHILIGTLFTVCLLYGGPDAINVTIFFLWVIAVMGTLGLFLEPKHFFEEAKKHIKEEHNSVKPKPPKWIKDNADKLMFFSYLWVIGLTVYCGYIWLPIILVTCGFGFNKNADSKKEAIRALREIKAEGKANE